MSIEDIKARADAATEGPWVWSPNTWTVEDTPPFDLHRFDTMSQIISRIDTTKRDGEFIAHARQDIPKLIAALEAVEAEATALDGLSSEVVGEDLRSGLRLAARGIRKVITESLA